MRGPVAWLSRLSARRAISRPAPLPVVAVGSLSTGGTGKTPTVIALAQRLAGQGREVHVVTRGDGAAVRINEREHRAEEVGDEPLLIAAFSPTWTALDALEGINAAKAAGAEVVVLDGGVPDGTVSATLNILVEDAVRGFGNGRVRPFGPLKTSLQQGLTHADLLISIGPKQAQERFAASVETGIAQSFGRLVPLQTGMTWSGMRVYAFAGIGVPERFFATLHDAGAEIVARHALTDHQELTAALMTRMEREAWALGAQMVTTEKDAVRLPTDMRRKVLVLPVRMELDDWAPVDAQLLSLFDPA
ncbi:tetraacyldisaccharide 4'-kinase [Maritimibacter dapengensis]|uniref:Tetraacyldisaccharide 4'-kinase n=1 Tax=Maritimibacter dapengensis TaxID=2836868 RepID=A0ABS6T4S0_9RHOB|nr:tetraacyldisaccharide 4'-kinase [Maritimibacter dapengensis]MBV7380224.1 tetraacyldisaccharide 4'-kinase [Maritimibacter dapengensis]